MNSLVSFVATRFPGKEYRFYEKIQSLWSGYGSIERWKNGKGESIVIKLIHFPDNKIHPRGWNSDFGHLRKVKSYEVENTWYENFGHKSFGIRISSIFTIVRTHHYVCISMIFKLASQFRSIVMKAATYIYTKTTISCT